MTVLHALFVILLGFGFGYNYAVLGESGFKLPPFTRRLLERETREKRNLSFQLPEVTRHLLEQPSRGRSLPYPEDNRRLNQRLSNGCPYGTGKNGVILEPFATVPVENPCLNCTCVTPVVVCYLKVCHTDANALLRPGCFLAREPGECCPKVICGGAQQPKPRNESDPTLDLRPTFKPLQETISLDNITTVDTETTSASSPFSGSAANITPDIDETTMSTNINVEATSTEHENLLETTEILDINPTIAEVVSPDTEFYTPLPVDKKTTSTITPYFGSAADSTTPPDNDFYGTFTPTFDSTDGSTRYPDTDEMTMSLNINEDATSTEHENLLDTTEILDSNPTIAKVVSPDIEFYTPLPVDKKTKSTTTPSRSTADSTTPPGNNFYGTFTPSFGSTYVSIRSPDIGETTVSTNINEASTSTEYGILDINPTTAAVVTPDIEFYTPEPENQSLEPITSTEAVEDFYIKNTSYGSQGCLVNGTMYGDGSAMLSTSFCEYCFCIRGETTCIKPKCQLTIEGCEPQYESPYTCCPSRYVCKDDANVTALANAAASDSWTIEDNLTEQYFVYTSPVPNEAEATTTKYPTTKETLTGDNSKNDSDVLGNEITLRPPTENSTEKDSVYYDGPINEESLYTNGLLTHTTENSAETFSVYHDGPISEESSSSLPTDTKENSAETVSVYHHDPISEESSSTTSLPTDTRENSVNRLRQPTDCIVKKFLYHQGEEVPNYKYCHDCHCINSTVRCERVKCRPSIPNCKPIIPPGYCCPVSYRCDASAVLIKSKTNIRPVQSYTLSHFEPLNAESTEEPTPLMRNPIQLRMDNDYDYEENSSVEDIGSVSPIYIGQRSSAATVTGEHIRENDKTLKLELNGTAYGDGYPDGENTSTSDFESSTQVSVGNPEIQILTIRELFEKLYGKQQSNLTKVSDATSLEPRRNNSKQPSSIVEIPDFEPDASETSAIEYTNRNIQTEKTTEINDKLVTVDTETEKIKTELFAPTTDSTINTTEEDLNFTINSDSTINTTEEDLNFTINSDSTINTTEEDLNFTINSEDPLETSSSQIYETISNLPYLKFTSKAPTGSPFTFTREELQQTHTTESEYTTAKKALIEELQGQTQPVVLVYGATRNFQTEEPTEYTQDQSTSLSHDTSNVFSSEAQTSSEETPEFWYGSVKDLFTHDDTKLTNTPLPTYTTMESIYNGLKSTEEADSVASTLRKQNNNEQTETSFSPVYLNTPDSIDYDEEMRTTLYPAYFRPQFINDPHQTEAYPFRFYVTPKNPRGQSETETSLSPMHGSTSEIISEEKQTESQFPANYFNSSENIMNNNHTQPTSSDTAIINTTIVRVPVTEKYTDNSDAKESVKFSTRINSKVPTFNNQDNGDKINENSEYTRYHNIPSTSDSVVKVYFPIQGRENAPLEAEETDKDSGKIKGPRMQEALLNAGQGYRVIPFVAEDAVRGQFGKLNNTPVGQPGGTEQPGMISDFCFVSGRIHHNGEKIVKADPCETCRCFYGRQLCARQRCPTQPDCIAEKVKGFCCPRFICANNTTFNSEINKEVQPEIPGRIFDVPVPTTRRPEILVRNPPTNDRQEIKYGIRVKVRPTQGLPMKIANHTTETKVLLEKLTTVKPETTVASTTTSTTTRKPITVPSSTTKVAEVKSTTPAPTTSTTAKSFNSNPFDLFKISGCNVYGKYYDINAKVEIPGHPCSPCTCTVKGIECDHSC